MSLPLAIEAISEFYGDQKAERSGVPYMNHIHEGLEIMRYRKSIGFTVTHESMEAFALHPIMQADNGLANGIDYLSRYEFSTKVLLLVMEYRKSANSYLTKPDANRNMSSPSDIYVINNEVREMLVADKIQNYKDFVKYFDTKDSRYMYLFDYFQNWMMYLNVTNYDYNFLIEVMEGVKND